jgi:predicted dehydrogenase
MLVGYRAGDVWAPQLDISEALGVEIRHFIDCIKNDKTPIVDGHAGLRVVRLLEAATQSMRSAGRTIELAGTRCAA